ncbi:MAG: IPTL-CTERM sorting domain-containing protein [Burkholderiaceae bacterium]
MKNKARRLIAATAIALLGSATSAAPFASTYSGTVGPYVYPDNDFPGVAVGTGFTVTLIFDNGGDTALGQTWPQQSFRCAIWRVGGGAIVYAASGTATGAAVTDASGVLTGMYTDVRGTSASPAGSSGSIALTGPVTWFANDHNPVFIDGVDDHILYATGTGVSMDPSHWTTPQRVTGECDDTPYAAPPATPTATPVPTLGHGALALLGAGVAGLAAWRRRRGGA